MTRIKISIAILLLLAGTGIFSGIQTTKECNRIIEEMDSVEECFISGDIDKAVSAAKKLDSQIKEMYNKTAAFIRRDKLSEIELKCSKIKFLAETSDSELISTISELKHMTELLKGGEIPYLKSVF